MEDLYPYFERDLYSLLLEIPHLKSFTKFPPYSYYEIRIDDRYFYIAINDTGLYFVIECPERRSIPSKSQFYEDHFNFTPEDEIWEKKPFYSRKLGKETKILQKLNNESFKEKFGLCYYELKTRLLVFPYQKR